MRDASLLTNGNIPQAIRKAINNNIGQWPTTTEITKVNKGNNNGTPSNLLKGKAKLISKQTDKISKENLVCDAEDDTAVVRTRQHCHIGAAGMMIMGISNVDFR